MPCHSVTRCKVTETTSMELLTPNHPVKSTPAFPSQVQGPLAHPPHGRLPVGAQGLLRASTAQGSPIPLKSQVRLPSSAARLGACSQGPPLSMGDSFSWASPPLLGPHLTYSPATAPTERGPPMGLHPSLASGRCPEPGAAPRAPRPTLLPGWGSGTGPSCRALTWGPPAMSTHTPPWGGPTARGHPCTMTLGVPAFKQSQLRLGLFLDLHAYQN